MSTGRGGIRQGTGRPKGSTSINSELRAAAQEHTKDALGVLVSIMLETGHPNQLKAAEMVLARGYGEPKPEPPSYQIISDFMAGDISAITASIMLEAEGGL